MENQNDDKVKCPFCGYEMDKGAKRCENCAGVIEKESSIANDSINTESANLSEKNIINGDKGSEDQTVYNTNNEETAGPIRPNYIPYEKAYDMNKLVPPAPRKLTNGLKVTLTALCVMIPIFGQFLGLVLSIIFMNADDRLKDCDDRRSFGLCLLIACVVAFIVSVFWGFVILIGLSKTL